ncbi:histidine kinase [Nocardioides szechwanensis]|uniref:histidine kinase n=1 Tax=Nocardioides szechwanensis TaxID=1005944 RepID=A0A1H0FDW8_9ACTN|nr:sensor histidine kinase [Nocardioides szechwanensis]GEP35811.1 histidine kinase [Nocardioides szechwanensis]SDN92917.1 Signal transduction histidine kinase [Nocardioides szechwanensis]
MTETPPAGVHRVLLDSSYASTAFVIALPAFVLVVVVLAVGLGLSVIVGGVVLLTLGTLVARGFAGLERVRLRSLQGRAAPTPEYLRAPHDAGLWTRMVTPLRDPQSWLDVLWAVVGLVTAVLAFALTVAWWGALLIGLTYWFWQRFIPYDPDDNVTVASLIGLGEGRGAESVLMLGIGVFALVTLPFAMRLAAVCHASLADVLLTTRAELQGEVRRMAGSREAAHLAEADSLRRLERDIHDGPQQRLVRLTMDLGRARKQLADDPERAAETIDAALTQARDTVDELRALSRGIAPPLLVDRGLAVALSELLARSVVPVESAVDIPYAFAPQVETAVYFVVSEALTNVAKHSGATRVDVTVRGLGDHVEVRVHDDGVGGAHAAKGNGLAGLEQRLAGVEGSFEVTSPPGGPTEVRADIPTVRG